jgi:hypothetical protein
MCRFFYWAVQFWGWGEARRSMLCRTAALACVVALPEVGVSTALAFRELDERGAANKLELTSRPDCG